MVAWPETSYSRANNEIAPADGRFSQQLYIVQIWERILFRVKKILARRFRMQVRNRIVTIFTNNRPLGTDITRRRKEKEFFRLSSVSLPLKLASESESSESPEFW